MFPALLALLPSLIQMGQGIAQKAKAGNLTQSNYVPPSIQNATEMARQGAATPTAPGYTQQINRVRTSTSNTISNAKKVAGDAAQLQSMVGQADAREKQIGQDLTSQNQNFQFNNRQDLMKWLGIRAGSEQGSRNAYNAAKSALIGAGDQNLFNAATGASAVGITALGGQKGDASVLGGSGGTKTMLPGGVNNIQSLIDQKKAGVQLTPQQLQYLKGFGIGDGENAPNASINFDNYQFTN